MPKPRKDTSPHANGSTPTPAQPTHQLPADPANALGSVKVWVADCRDWLNTVTPESADLVFADPPFNWNRGYEDWNDAIPENQYLNFTYDWLDGCVRALKPGGSLWVNIPDDWAAEIVCYLKSRLPRTPPATLAMANWCIWHYRFGQNTRSRFINSKVHALYFIKAGAPHTWNPDAVLEYSDRRAIYEDPRTENKKDGSPAGLRLPMDVWYGKYWGRIQGNNAERRANHDNQLPEVYLERVIRACSNEQDLVLDPFLGSGTTALIARALNRNFIGSEFSTGTAASAFQRIALGPVRVTRHITPQSTAIFPHRRAKADDAPTLYPKAPART